MRVRARRNQKKTKSTTGLEKESNARGVSAKESASAMITCTDISPPSAKSEGR